ncbi:MAG: DNA repair protein RadA [Ruminococcaceae bacterium]|nr:DNA repair protein RadA [Oscillospiraceae bacterium]
MAKTEKIKYVCRECGAIHDKWHGKCKECSSWDTLEEQVEFVASGATKKPVAGSLNNALKLSDFDVSKLHRERFISDIPEFDRVMGGGIVKGSVALISGEPGIGKSTLLLQICQALSHLKVLYVSGEESAMQIKMRAQRLGVNSENLFILCENELEKIEANVNSIAPDLLIVDSIQTVSSSLIPSSSGSITQVRDCSGVLINLTKKGGFATVLVGHVNKDGAIAGPKLLEHMVDVVLYFEGDRSDSCRVIRAIKNRYGSTNEIGLFEMCDKGLVEVPDPSKRLLEDSPQNVPGSCPVCLMEGTRPIIAEVQALAAKSPFQAPKRSSSGVDFNRMNMLLAVLEKRLGLRFFDKDVYLNVIGGLRLDETAADMGIAAALISCVKDIPLSGSVIAIGEIGLSGECRTVGSIDLRINEAVRLGFDVIIIPYRTRLKYEPEGVKLIRVKSVFELLTALADFK